MTAAAGSALEGGTAVGERVGGRDQDLEVTGVDKVGELGELLLDSG